MKKIKVRFPLSKANEISQFIGENLFALLLSWSQKEGMFDDATFVYAYIAYPEDKEDKIKANLQQYFVKN